MPLIDTKTFLDENFLLESDAAIRLYYEHASGLPIIDYHCHLPPDEIASNRQFENLTRIWLDGDHYKWRAMRTLGIPEKYITGDASDREKFKAWAKCVPYTMRNPLYHWSHLELQRYFGVDQFLNEDTAEFIYDHCSELLQSDEFRVKRLLEKINVEVVCTTDDPVDDLNEHTILSESGFPIKVLPAFRPDKILAIENPGDFSRYVDQLAQCSGQEITGFSQLCDALDQRMGYFHNRGCRLSDHGLEHLYASQASRSEVFKVFSKALDGSTPTPVEADQFRTEVLLHLCRGYHQLEWVQQFHLGALRNTNERMEKILGPNTGFDSIGDFPQAQTLSKFLDILDRKNELSKTILYNLNPGDNEVLATMIGNFNDGTIRGKMQFGSGWWYLDQKDGMEQQMNTLSNMGLISCFVGMLTDSRSFLSYPRHEYFRRILCNLFGSDIEHGLLPADFRFIGGLIEDICYRNAKNYFNF